MPLVRIDTMKRDDSTWIQRVGEIIYQSMRQTIAVPESDHFQILNEHDSKHIVYSADYLDIPRTDDIIYIQITLNEGRTLEQKRALFQTIAVQLHEQLGMRTEDVFVNLVEVKKENWSFGNGVAQYAVASK